MSNKSPRLANAANTKPITKPIRIVTSFRNGTVSIAHGGWRAEINCVPPSVLDEIRAGRGDWQVADRLVHDVAEGLRRTLTRLLEDVPAKSLGEIVVEHLT